MLTKVYLFTFGVLGVLLMAGASAQDMRERQTEACMGDAFRLCGDAIPDEGRIEACMNAKRAELNPGCRAYFTDASVKDDDTPAPKASSRSNHVRVQSVSIR